MPSPVHGLEMQDPEARVVNPRWRALDRNIQRLRQQPRHPAEPDRRFDPGRAIPPQPPKPPDNTRPAAMRSTPSAKPSSSSAGTHRDTSPSPTSTNRTPCTLSPKAKNSSSTSSE